MSTCEAESIALSEVVREVIWMRAFLKEAGATMNEPTLIYCDNQATIAVTKNPEHRKRTKHIDVRFQFVRDAYLKKEIVLSYIETKKNVADIFTKALPLRFHKENLGVKKVAVEVERKGMKGNGNVLWSAVVKRGA